MALKQHKAVKDFPYNDDPAGLPETAREVKAGDLLTVRPDLVRGLEEGGFIVADGSAAEAVSKAAGERMASADHSGAVDDQFALERDMNVARSGISDGNIGAPEAASILDQHKLTENSHPNVIAAAQQQKAALAGDTAADANAPARLAEAGGDPELAAAKKEADDKAAADKAKAAKAKK